VTHGKYLNSFSRVHLRGGVAVPLVLWLGWWESYLSVMDKGLSTREIFHKAARH